MTTDDNLTNNCWNKKILLNSWVISYKKYYYIFLNGKYNNSLYLFVRYILCK